MKVQFFICNHCGNIVAMIKDQGVPIKCCGENMQEITAGSSEGTQEKHTPVYHIDGETVTVSVGEVAHPMTPEHYIDWVNRNRSRLPIQKINARYVSEGFFFINQR